MKRCLLFTGLIFLLFPSFAQDVKQLLQQSFSKCQAINNGYYEMEKHMKFMDQKDTTNLAFKLYFRKLEHDSIYPVAFNYQHFYNGQYLRNVLYTGDEYVTFSSQDSTGQIMSKPKWTAKMMLQRHGDLFNFYAPFTGALYSPFPKDSDYVDNKHIFRVIGRETVNDFSCFHIQVVEFPTYDRKDEVYRIKSTYDYWINKEDSLPVKYSASTKVINAGDTLDEYMAWSIKKYNLNNLQKDKLKQLQLSSIPSYCNLVEYAENNSFKSLKQDTIAPDWTLVSLENKKIRLTDYKGSLVLIDFFYKACYPCIRTFPILESLNEKYKNRGLKIIGVNNIDKNKESLKSFLSKRGVSYTVALDAGEVVKNYQVDSYPTIYLIDKSGKIVFANIGFKHDLKESLEEIITSHL